MLYLEDYLEMIENLPMEMRERLTEMREMDLQVQNALDSLDEKVKGFFKKCQQPTMKTECKDESFKKIKEEYYKALEDADEKVQLANHIHDLVDRHLRKLDLELLKFKMELEADNAGITEVLEKRSLEMDIPPSSGNSLRSERKRAAHPPPVTNHSDHKRITTEKVLSNIANEAARETIGLNKKTNSASSSPALSMFNSSTSSSQSSLGYGIGHIGSGSSNAAIAAAASQAIAATQQMQQGRRTPSMKASYVAMTKSTQDLTKDFSFTKDSPLVSPASTTSEPSTKSQRKKQQTKTVVPAAQPQPLPPPPPPSTILQPSTPVTPQPSFDTPSEDVSTELQIVDENGQPVDWQNDPNEPRYCLCNQVSYGEMVGCDNDDCPIEWFHYGCVGLTQAPKGKWFCPQCTAALKRRGRR